MCAAVVVVFKNAVYSKSIIRHTFVRVFERKNKEKQSILYIFERKFCDETNKKLNKTQLGGGGNNKRGKIGHYKKFLFSFI